MPVRLDKWLQVARVFKTRSQATRACAVGRVRVGGAVAKAHRKVSVEDRIEVRLKGRTRALRVKEIQGRPVPKAQARTLYEDLSVEPVRSPADPFGGMPPAPRSVKGRPTKRDRRRIDRWRRDTPA